MVEGTLEKGILEKEKLVDCDRCEGLGYHIDLKTGYESTCNKCWGYKKLDWVESITGKKKPKITWSGFSGITGPTGFSGFSGMSGYTVGGSIGSSRASGFSGTTSLNIYKPLPPLGRTDSTISKNINLKERSSLKLKPYLEIIGIVILITQLIVMLWK